MRSFATSRGYASADKDHGRSFVATSVLSFHEYSFTNRRFEGVTVHCKGTDSVDEICDRLDKNIKLIRAMPTFKDPKCDEPLPAKAPVVDTVSLISFAMDEEPTKEQASATANINDIQPTNPFDPRYNHSNDEAGSAIYQDYSHLFYPATYGATFPTTYDSTTGTESSNQVALNHLSDLLGVVKEERSQDIPVPEVPQVAEVPDVLDDEESLLTSGKNDRKKMTDRINVIRHNFHQLKNALTSEQIELMFLDLEALRIQDREKDFIKEPKQLGFYKKRLEAFLMIDNRMETMKLKNLGPIISKFADIYGIEVAEGKEKFLHYNPFFVEFFFHLNFKEVGIKDLSLKSMGFETFWSMLETALESYYRLEGNVFKYNKLPPGLVPSTKEPVMSISCTGELLGRRTFWDVLDQFKNPMRDECTSIGHYYHNWINTDWKTIFSHCINAKHRKHSKRLYNTVNYNKALKAIVYLYHDLLADCKIGKKEMADAFLTRDAHYALMCQTIMDFEKMGGTLLEPLMAGPMLRKEWPVRPWTILQILQDTIPRQYSSFMEMVDRMDGNKEDIELVAPHFCELYRIEKSGNSFIGYKVNRVKEDVMKPHWNTNRFIGKLRKTEKEMPKQSENTWLVLEVAGKRYYDDKVRRIALAKAAPLVIL